jgi:probable rRNA maturation factor
MPKQGEEFSIPFTDIKNSVLSLDYELSLVFIDKKFSRELNKTYRGKSKQTNVLAFPLSKNSGEIFIDLDTAKKEAQIFEMSFPKFVEYLFIHGCLHLKGMRHGATMEQAEKLLLHGTPNSSRYRHRHFSS